MTAEQFCYPLFVNLSFIDFGLALAASYVLYRRWLAT